MNKEYLAFIESKKHSSIDYGIDPVWFPDEMFDYQKYVTEKTIKKGRYANFLDTGTGKTIIELTTAYNYVLSTNKPVLIITPLAVAFQFIKEAEKFGIDDISYSKDGKYKTKIVVCNYERLDKFDSKDFDCVILDESSILKNFDGAIKSQVTSFMKKVKYRYLFTATPSPNDFVELGTSSEALGYMGYTDMLGKFFTNNEDTIKPQNIGTKWILKGHAEDNFFKWVSSWSISMRKPSDLGFSDERHILPELITNHHSITNPHNLVINGQMQMFAQIARRLTEVREEQKMTIDKRCEKAAELVDDKDISFVWCNLNDEANLLKHLIPNSIEISGSDSIEQKEDAIMWFLGEKCLCNTKKTNTFGINWQNNNVCGKKNTQKKDVKSINLQKKKEKSEKNKVEILMRTKSICQSIIKITNQNLNLTNLSNQKKTLNVESVILKIKNIEKNVNCQPKKVTLPRTDLRELLNSMVSLLNNIKHLIKSKEENVQYVSLKFQTMEKVIDYLLTIAILQEKSEDYYVQNAISESDISTTIQNYLNEQSCTCGYESGKRVLISKTKIFGFGLNLQHCNHTVYFPTFSYEQYYQAIRRFWRYGQTKPVTVDLVYSDGQKRVIDSLIAKTKKANDLFNKLNTTLNSDYTTKQREFNKEIIKPSFLN